jgi:hypothetical protein
MMHLHKIGRWRVFWWANRHGFSVGWGVHHRKAAP